MNFVVSNFPLLRTFSLAWIWVCLNFLAYLPKQLSYVVSISVLHSSLIYSCCLDLFLNKSS